MRTGALSGHPQILTKRESVYIRKKESRLHAPDMGAWIDLSGSSGHPGLQDAQKGDVRIPGRLTEKDAADCGL